MKKVLFIVAALMVCAGIQAQIVSSRSSIVKTEKSEKIWYVRAGLALVNMSAEGESVDANMGYNVMFGYQKPMGAAGAYWGMEFGVGTRGYKYDEYDYSEKALAHAVQYSPFTFGWKFNVADKLQIDPHAGIYAGYDFSSKCKLEEDGYSEDCSWGDGYEDYNAFDAGLNLGVGVWYGRFNFDVTYQKGFVSAIGDAKAKNILIRLGIAF